jgi:hypothetical protein
MAGSGVFDLDGALVAAVLACNGRYAALSLESVTLGLARGRSPEGRQRAFYGLRVGPLDEAVGPHLGTESGVLVSDVWKGLPADLGGLRPGDVIVGVRSRAVSSPEDLQPLLAPVEQPEVVLAVWCARRKQEIRLPTGGPRATDAGPGLSLAPLAKGFHIGPVAPGSLAAEAGTREGDALLSGAILAGGDPPARPRAHPEEHWSPMPQSAASKRSSSKGSFSAGAWCHSIHKYGGVVSLATASMARLGSTPATVPSRPTSAAASFVTTPVPQATSNARSPRRRLAPATSASGAPR